MKINKILFIATFLITLASNAQIDKGNWMMGGGANFGAYKNTSGGIKGESRGIGIYPNIGYFVIDKLALGASGELGFSSDTNTNYGISPFIRYYFLEKEKTINIFSEVSYGISRINKTDYNFQKFNLKAGTVFFVNSSVGIEVSLNYSSRKDNQDSLNEALYLGVGFQIHLEKR